MKKIPIEYYSLAILKEPEGKNKGALILSQVDDVVSKYPLIKKHFYIIERRGWRGLNDSQYADIKLVEDLSYWNDTLKKFPNTICLDIGPADFVDTNVFRPLYIEKEYDGIQVSHWTAFKRPEMFIKAAAMLPHRRFIKLGHFVKGGSELELKLRGSCIRLSKRLKANIEFPYSNAINNDDFSNSKRTMNYYINRCCIGVLTTKVEGINRFKMECLAADIPMLVPQDTSYPTKKHINEKTGLFFEPTPEELAKTIEYALTHLGRFSPREYIICLLYTSPSPRDLSTSRMPSSA